MPSPPAHLSDDARIEWARIADGLYESGLLTAIDATVFGAYCQSYGRWMQAERALTGIAKRDQLTDGLLVKTKKGNAIPNPIVGTANKAMSDAVRFAAELGMTPSARSRISAFPPAKADADDEDFFR